MTSQSGGGLSDLGHAVKWFTAPKSLRLRPGRVHIWRIDLQRAGDAGSLNSVELGRLGRLVRPLARQRFLRSRQCVREILGRYLGLAPREVPIVVGQVGKPMLTGGQNLHFNLTHAEDIGLLAVTTGVPVGIDLEWQRPLNGRDTLAHMVLPESVIADMASDPDDWERGFLACWTRYEATQKAFGLGIFAKRAVEIQLCWRHFVPESGSLACVALACADECFEGMYFFSHCSE